MSSIINEDIRTYSAPALPRVRWSAIFAGWLVGMGVSWLMYLLGLAAGFTAIDAANAENVAKGLSIGTGVWILLTWVVSLFLGGMFAAWFDGKTDHTVGTLHGIAVWALSISVMVVFAAMGFSNLLQAGGSLLKGGATVAATGAAGAAQAGDSGSGALGTLQAEIKNQIAQAVAGGSQGGTAVASSGNASATSGANAPSASTGANAPAKGGDTGANAADVRKAMESIDKDTMAAVTADFVRGNTDQARARIAAETGLPQDRMDQVMQAVQQKTEQYKQQAKEAADKAAHYSAAAMWALFASVLLSMVAAGLGGWMGARNVHRVYDDLETI